MRRLLGLRWLPQMGAACKPPSAHGWLGRPAARSHRGSRTSDDVRSAKRGHFWWGSGKPMDKSN